jgi:hypothetical protein
MTPENPEKSIGQPISVLLGIWILAAVAAPFFLDQGNYLGFFPTMIVHELGHSVFSFLSGIPAISFFFASFSFATEPSIGLVAVLIALEILGSWSNLSAIGFYTAI